MLAEFPDKVSTYRCPGEPRPISRAVHLGRLSRFYSGCERCPHRHDLGLLPPKLARRLREHFARRASDASGRAEDVAQPAWDAGPSACRGSHSAAQAPAVSGERFVELEPVWVRRIAAAFGVALRQRLGDWRSEPTVVMAGDGGAASARPVAAAAEGLRWAGCHVIDAGPATAGSLVSSLARLAAHGALLAGRSGPRCTATTLWLWHGDGRPLDEVELEGLRQASEAGVARPTRRYGPLRRVRARQFYLDELAGHYHGLRPLRLVVQSSSPAAMEEVASLVERSGCQLLAGGPTIGPLARQVADRRAHLGVRIEEDGQRCEVVDERGCAVSSAQLIVLAAAHLAGPRRKTVVVEQPAAGHLGEALGRLGLDVVAVRPGRAAVYRAVRAHKAILGGGTDGRFWYSSADGTVGADGIMTLTILLRILSRSDHTLSQVLRSGDLPHDGRGGLPAATHALGVPPAAHSG